MGKKVPLLRLPITASSTEASRPQGSNQQQPEPPAGPGGVTEGPGPASVAYLEERSKRVLYTDSDLHVSVSLAPVLLIGTHSSPEVWLRPPGKVEDRGRASKHPPAGLLSRELACKSLKSRHLHCCTLRGTGMQAWRAPSIMSEADI